MIPGLIRFVRENVVRIVSVLLAITVASLCWSLYGAAVRGVSERVSEAAAEHHTGEYDILVRAPGTRTALEEDQGLVPPNYLASLSGGITFPQYEAVRRVPGVSIAAPLARLGYHETCLHIGGGSVEGQAAYVIRCAACNQEGEDDLQQQVIYGYTDATTSLLYGPAERGEGIWTIRRHAGCYFDHTALLMAVDPAAEAALFGLRRATQGCYLGSGDVETGATSALVIPALWNGSDYTGATLSYEFARLTLPTETIGEDEILALGGRSYLESLAESDMILGQSISVERLAELRSRMLLTGVVRTTNLVPSDGLAPVYPRYRESALPGTATAIPVAAYEALGARPDRVMAVELDGRLKLNVGGVFYPEGLSHSQTGAAALELYGTSSAVLRYDEAGQPLEPVVLRPGLQPESYLQPAPAFLVTLDVARQVGGEAPISAVRVRVASVDDLSPHSLARIKAVADEIAARTGLVADIVAGSSTRPVLVHVPTVGYVEQTWIQRGAVQDLLLAVDLASIRLGWVVALLCVLLALASVARQSRGLTQYYALLTMVGWCRSASLVLALSVGLLLGTVAGGVGLALAAMLAAQLGWPQPPSSAVVAVAVLAVVCAVGQTLALRRTTPRLSGARHTHKGAMARIPAAVRIAAITALCAGVVGIQPVLFRPLEAALAATALGEVVAATVAPFGRAASAIALCASALAIGHTVAAQVLHAEGDPAALTTDGWPRRHSFKAVVRREWRPMLVGGGLGVLVTSLLIRLAGVETGWTSTLADLAMILVLAAPAAWLLVRLDQPRRHGDVES